MRILTRSLLALVLVLTVTVAMTARAADDKASAAQAVGKALTFAMKTVSKKIDPPKTATNKEAIAAEINIVVPEFTGAAGAEAAAAKINKVVQDQLLAMIGEKPAASLDQMVEVFTKDYEQSFKDQPEMPGAWLLRFESGIRHADDDLLCIEISASVFTGGAHPNSTITYLVLSPKTGEPVTLDSIVPTSNTNDLLTVAEKAFRKARNLKPDETYEQAGFQFEQNRFVLTKNFLLSKDGLAFCYNHYEIAPYAMGITELLIPWTDLKPIVNPAGPAAAFLK